jgi:hypothetical protein
LQNALLLGLDGFTNIRQTDLLGFKLTESATDDAFHQAHVFADLPGTQALSFDYLNDMEFETRVKASSGF